MKPKASGWHAQGSNGHLFAVPRDAHLPPDSWWTKARTRADFDAKQAKAQDRMDGYVGKTSRSYPED